MLAAGQSSITSLLHGRIQEIFIEFQRRFRQNAPILGARPEIQETLSGPGYTGYRKGVSNNWFHSEYLRTENSGVTETYSRKVRMATGWQTIQLGVNRNYSKQTLSEGYFVKLFNDKGTELIVVSDYNCSRLIPCLKKRGDTSLVYYDFIEGALKMALK